MNDTDKLHIFSDTYLRAAFQGFILNGVTLAPTSQVRTDVMLILLVTGNYKIGLRRWEALQSHNVHTQFMKIDKLIRNLLDGTDGRPFT